MPVVRVRGDVVRLCGALRLQRLKRPSGQGNASPAGGALGWPHSEPALAVLALEHLKRVANVQHSRFKVNILPAEPQNLACAHPGMKRQQDREVHLGSLEAAQELPHSRACFRPI